MFVRVTEDYIFYTDTPITGYGWPPTCERISNPAGLAPTNGWKDITQSVDEDALWLWYQHDSSWRETIVNGIDAESMENRITLDDMYAYFRDLYLSNGYTIQKIDDIWHREVVDSVPDTTSPEYFEDWKEGIVIELEERHGR